jgi:beta-galactosidase
VSWQQFSLGGQLTASPARRRIVEVETTDTGIAGVRIGDDTVIEGDIVPWLWRAPTDNDGVRQGWMSEIQGRRRAWLRWGLDEAELVTDSVTRRRRGDAEIILIARRIVGPGEEARHRTMITIETGVARFDERIDLPSRWRDMPRVGVRFEVPASFDRLEWFGLGPHETYPDRNSSATIRRWTSTVDAQYHPYVVPQEHAAHVATRWMTLTSKRGRGLRIEGARPLVMTARPHHDADLTAAATLADLERAGTTEVHIDAAVRGLGTDACGPDTLPEFIVGAGSHRWSWYLGPAR